MANEQVPWNQQENEPNESFYWFEKFFLMLGPTRTLDRAYKAYNAIEKPDIEDTSVRPNGSWIDACETYNWRQRADAFDAKLFNEDGAVELARSRLRRATLEA